MHDRHTPRPARLSMAVSRRPILAPHAGVAFDAMPSGLVRRPRISLAFAAALRAACVQAGRIQADVAEKAGLSGPVLQRAQQGLRGVSIGEAAGHRPRARPVAYERVEVSGTASFEPPRMGRPSDLDDPQPMNPTR